MKKKFYLPINQFQFEIKELHISIHIRCHNPIIDTGQHSDWFFLDPYDLRSFHLIVAGGLYVVVVVGLVRRS